MKSRGSELVFDDGTIVRFWGTNLTANAIFGTPKEDVEREVRRLSQLGFNMIRLHHIDSPWVIPNIFGGAGSSTNRLNPEMLNKLDWWIKCLRDQGIYIWLDLHVGREARASDGIDSFDEIAKGNSSISFNGFNYVNNSIRQAMQQFDDQLLGHENEFTGLRYRDDPAIAVMLITNENDLTQHFGSALLPDKHIHSQTALYLEQAYVFAAQHHLPAKQVWRSWEDGPSKLFLNDLERRFDAEMIMHLRAFGAKTPLVTTSSWGLDPLSSLPALTVGDIIDAHSYGGKGELSVNPLRQAGLIDWVASAQVAGKPLTVSEWGADRDNRAAADRQSLPLYIASIASMQGWRAVLFYAYAQEPLTTSPGTTSVYQAYNDPGLLATLPAAALLFRQQHVSEATTTYVFLPNEKRLFAEALTPGNSIALRTAAARGKLTIGMPRVAELPWLRPTTISPGAIVIDDPGQSQLPPAATEVVSNNAEIVRNWGKGIFKVNTARSQVIEGNIHSEPVVLPGLRAHLNGDDSVVAVQSLDSLAIEDSRSIMISVSSGANVVAGRSAGYESQAIIGTVEIRAKPRMQLLEWNNVSAKLESREVLYRNGRYVIALNGELKSSWLFLRATRL